MQGSTVFQWPRIGLDPFMYLTALEEAEIIPGKDSDTRIKPLALTNDHGRYMLHDRYIRTGTCVRWGMSVKYIAVNFCPFHFRDGRLTAVSRLTSETPVRRFQK